jgi:hypothetical protein
MLVAYLFRRHIGCLLARLAFDAHALIGPRLLRVDALHGCIRLRRLQRPLTWCTPFTFVPFVYVVYVVDHISCSTIDPPPPAGP